MQLFPFFLQLLYWHEWWWLMTSLRRKYLILARLVSPGEYAFAVTSNGRPKIIYEGHGFVQDIYGGCKDREKVRHFRCSKKSLGCKARLSMNHDTSLYYKNGHNHPHRVGFAVLDCWPLFLTRYQLPVHSSQTKCSYLVYVIPRCWAKYLFELLSHLLILLALKCLTSVASHVLWLKLYSPPRRQFLTLQLFICGSRYLF